MGPLRMMQPITNLREGLFKTSHQVGEATLVGQRSWREKLREVSRGEAIPIFILKHFMLLCQFSFGTHRLFLKNIPRIATRYTRDYLSMSFLSATRREILLFHHRFIIRKLEYEFLYALSTSRSVLWNASFDDHTYEIILSTEKSLHGVGDLILEFFDGDVCLFDISFSFSPARAVGHEGEVALLVARVQGRPNLFDTIRRATKACGDIFPGHLLVAAAEGVATALSVSTICGICSEQQLSSRWKGGRFDYDEFWSELLEERRDGWYSATVPLPRKPLSEIAISHRRRTKRKRLFKDGVAHTVSQTLATNLKRAAGVR